MKGPAARFVNHKGDAHERHMHLKKKKVSDHIGFLDLWRYASAAEVAATVCGAALGTCGAVLLVGAVALYGELTALFVWRTRALPSPAAAPLLTLFAGGRILAGGEHEAHMDALVEDAVAFALASLAVMALQWAAAGTAVALVNWAASSMVTRLRLRLLRCVLSQEIAYFDSNTSMNFASMLTEDMEKLRAGVGEHVAMTAYLAGTVVAGGALALFYGWELTLAGLALVPPSIAVATLVTKKQTECSGEEVAAYGVAGKIAEEVLSAIRTVRAFAGEEIEVARFAGALGGASAAAQRRGAWAGAGAGLGWLLTYSLNAVVFAYGAALCVRDMNLPPDRQQYHPGVMVTVLFCTFMGAQNIAMCQPHLEVFSSARGAAKSLYELLERKSRINALGGGGVRPARFEGDVEFADVHFGYPSRTGVKVLRGLKLRVRAGETVALVGASGGGKSTVLQLLQRLYEPDAGTVRLDGRPLSDFDLRHYRRSIGVVGQEPVLFSGTVRDNITLGADDVSEEQLHAAARTAHAHHFILNLANGYDTVVGSGGAGLSGGQKQRVAIARAVLRQPALLLLDEPTSALDPAAEVQVQAALDEAAAGRTTLVVSHRLATIANATRIVYMEDGACAEQGSHEELLALRGRYWRLVQQDLTYGSVQSTLEETNAIEQPEREKEEEEKDAGEWSDRCLERSVDRHSLIQRESLRRAWRGSARLGSSTVPAVPAPDLLVHSVAPHSTDAEAGAAPEDAAGDVSSAALLRLHAAEWPLVAGGGLASFLVGATMPAFAFLFSKLYGMFSWPDGGAILAQSRLYAGIFAAVAALCGLVTFLQTWLFNVAGARLTRRLRVSCFRNFLRQEQGWFDEPANSVGALCARLSADCAAVQGATGTRLGTVLQGVSTMVLGVGLALAYSWKMTLVSLLSVPCVIGGICLEGYVNKRAEKLERRALERASRVATEAVLNVRTVQSLGVEEEMLVRYEAALEEAARSAAPARHVRGPVYGLCLCAPTLGYAVSLAYGGYLIAREGLQYEYAILVSEALIYGAWMLAEALSFAPSFAAARRSGSRILAALAREPRIVSIDSDVVDEADRMGPGEVEFADVDFRYPTRPRTAVLRGMSFKLEAGRTLALVGPSGCGKSTVVQLLLRNYEPAGGAVRLDGRDARRVPLPGLRAALGLVAQEPALFARSLRDNIAYGDTSRDVPMDEIVSAARRANVHSFIASLPLGYDTVVGGGTSLSGGQKQRVAIARALLRDPRVLLLDEATSALDAASEQSVQAALEEASRSRSTLVIAHRLATVRHAHTIALVHRGAVAESGTHEELVARRGRYWRLLQQQARAH